MATLNHWKLVLKPLGEQLRADPIFQNINIFYDRSPDHNNVTAADCPAINYFVDAPWRDESFGSHSATWNVRRAYLTVGFGVWYFDQSADHLDETLFEMSGTLQDWLRTHEIFDQVNAIDILGMLPGQADYFGDENGILGSHKVTAEFRIHSW